MGKNNKQQKEIDPKGTEGSRGRTEKAIAPSTSMAKASAIASKRTKGGKKRAEKAIASSIPMAKDAGVL